MLRCDVSLATIAHCAMPTRGPYGTQFHENPSEQEVADRAWQCNRLQSDTKQSESSSESTMITVKGISGDVYMLRNTSLFMSYLNFSFSFFPPSARSSRSQSIISDLK